MSYALWRYSYTFFVLLGIDTYLMTLHRQLNEM
jgi:hypothetical protein